jgi:hypothetical protein
MYVPVYEYRSVGRKSTKEEGKKLKQSSRYAGLQDSTVDLKTLEACRCDIRPKFARDTRICKSSTRSNFRSTSICVERVATADCCLMEKIIDCHCKRRSQKPYFFFLYRFHSRQRGWTKPTWIRFRSLSRFALFDEIDEENYTLATLHRTGVFHVLLFRYVADHQGGFTQAVKVRKNVCRYYEHICNSR